MKITKKYFAGIIAVALIAVISIAYSFEKPNRGQSDELRNDVKQYAKENILPKLSEWKAEIDAKLNGDDLTKLNSLRAQMRQHRLESRDQMKQRLQDGSGQGKDRQERRNARQEHRDEMKEIRNQVKPIADKYEKDLDALAEKAKPYVDKWQEDIKTIRDNWREEHQDEFENRKGNRSGREGRGNRGMNQMGNAGMMRFGMCPEGDHYRFLLWDGSTESFENDNDIFGKGMNSNSNNRNNDNLNRSHPNPFTDNTSISFYLPKDEKVQLHVFNSDGKLVQTLCNQKLSAGDHTYEFKPENDASGTYIYNLKSESLNKSGKMIFNK